MAGIAGFLLIFLFFETISRVAKGWFTAEGSHGLIILAVSLYWAYESRDRLKTSLLYPSMRTGTPILAVGCMAFLVAKWSATILLEEFALIIALLGMVGLFFGWSWLKILFLPITYLLFMSTFFPELLSPASHFMQHSTARIAASILRLTGMPVFLSENYLGLPHINLLVARECDGINHIFSLVALAVPLGYFTQKTWPRIIAVVFPAFGIGLLANGLRVAIIGLWSARYPDGPLHGPFNLFYASFIFMFGAILFSSSVLLFSRRSRRPSEQSDSLGFAGTPRSDEINENTDVETRWQGSSKVFAWLRATFLGIAVLGGSLYLSLCREPLPVRLSADLEDLPLDIDGWHGGFLEYSEEAFPGLRAHIELRRVYRGDNGRALKAYVGYFLMQTQSLEIVNDQQRWQREDTSKLELRLGDRIVPIAYYVPSLASGENSFYYWYDINGRILTNRYTTKATLIWNALTKRMTNGAIVIVQPAAQPGSTQPTTEEVGHFLRAFFPLVRECLASVAADRLSY
ncbi:MAG: exosortase W [candidate division WOR-3 bacterium]